MPNPTDKPSLAVLISGGGTTLLNLQKRIEQGTLNAAIDLVIASNQPSYDKVIAKDLGLTAVCLSRKQFDDKHAYSQAIFNTCREAGADLVCLAGFLSLLVIPDDFSGRVLNIHPSLLPKFGGKGMHGQHVHEAVLAAGEHESGCTVHFADNTYDTGPIVLQRTCPVELGDTPETLAARVFEQECEAYPLAIQKVWQDIQESKND